MVIWMVWLVLMMNKYYRNVILMINVWNSVICDDLWLNLEWFMLLEKYIYTNSGMNSNSGVNSKLRHE